MFGPVSWLYVLRESLCYETKKFAFVPGQKNFFLVGGPGLLRFPGICNYVQISGQKTRNLMSFLFESIETSRFFFKSLAMYQKFKKWLRSSGNLCRKSSNWLQKPKHLWGASPALYDFSRIFWPNFKNSGQGTLFEPNMSSFEQKVIELWGFSHWLLMAIFDPPERRDPAPGAPGTPRSKVPHPNVDPRWSFWKMQDKISGCWTAGLVLNEPLS